LKRNPNECPERFVRGIVHATFKDGCGYVEGLSSAKVDAFIKYFIAYTAQQIFILHSQGRLSSRAQLDTCTTSYAKLALAFYTHH